MSPFTASYEAFSEKLYLRRLLPDYIVRPIVPMVPMPLLWRVATPRRGAPQLLFLDASLSVADVTSDIMSITLYVRTGHIRTACAMIALNLLTIQLQVSRDGLAGGVRAWRCCAHRVSSTRCIPYGRILSMRCMLRAAFWRVCRVPPVAAWRRRRVCIFDRICASRPPLLQIVVVVVRTKHTGWRRVLREVRLAARNKQHAAFRHAMRWRRAVDGAPFLRFKSVAVWCRWHVACPMLRSAWCMLAVERCLLSLAL